MMLVDTLEREHAKETSELRKERDQARRVREEANTAVENGRKLLADEQAETRRLRQANNNYQNLVGIAPFPLLILE